MSKSPDRRRACPQVDTTTQLGAGEKPELVAKMTAVARAHRGYVRPSDDCVLAECHCITVDDLLALQGRSRWGPGAGLVFSFPPSFVEVWGRTNRSRIIAEAFSGAGSRAIARAALQALASGRGRLRSSGGGVGVGRIERWLPAPGHKRKVTNGAAGKAEKTLGLCQGWDRPGSRVEYSAANSIVWDVQ